MILGKALTAGYVGHVATIATSKIFNTFLGETYEEAFMHGPTFMGNPIACAVGLKSIEIFERENYLRKVELIEFAFKKAFKDFKHEKIKEIRVLGCMVVIETQSIHCVEGFKAYAIEKGLWLRPIGKFIYATPPFTITDKSLNKITEGLIGWFSN